jgi:mannose-1-phosphate guanylyltransferase
MSGLTPQAHAFILAGGRGTRFWPLSRHSRPKQFLDFSGEGSLLALTVARLTPLIPPERQWVITSEDLAPLVREVAPQIPVAQVLAEPEGKNTAPAVALAAALLESQSGEAVPFAVLPSDHVITPGDRFRASLDRALRAASREDALFTFGIPAQSPETGYGYIEAESMLDPAVAGPVRAFREKPDRATAEDYVKTGRHYWNSGIFVWNQRAVLEELSRHEPEIVAAVRKLAASGEAGTPAFAMAFEEAYASCRSVSIDYALLEKASEVRVIGADFEWDDVGHWNAMSGLWPVDGDENAARGELIEIDSHGNVVYGESGLTALVGVDSLIVVNTTDATLVCRRDRAQDIKALLERLREKGLDQYL